MDGLGEDERSGEGPGPPSRLRWLAFWIRRGDLNYFWTLDSICPSDFRRIGAKKDRPMKNESSAVMDMDVVQPWDGAVNGKELLDELAGTLRRFVVLPKWGAETLALWVLHTHAFRLLEVTTYIGIESPEKECGKSTLLTVLSRLVNRPAVSSNISASAFFRVIEELEPTLLIDEADTNLRGRDELRGILNAGYTKPTAFVWRICYEATGRAEGAAVADECGQTHGGETETGAEWSVERGSMMSGGSGADVTLKPEEFPSPQPLSPRRGEPLAALGKAAGRVARYSCWCPKAIAAIGHLHPTLASRCIVVRMQRKRAGEECERLKRLDTTELKRKCLRFVAEHEREIAQAEPQIPAGLTNRAADVWEPLLALADLAGGGWPELARDAAVGLTVAAQEHSPIGSLLLDILLVFTEMQRERVFSRELVAGLLGCGDRPWAELRRGKQLSEMWLAQRLRPYGIQPRTIRIGEAVGKGYKEEDFTETFRRYIPKAEVERLKAELAERAAPAGAGGIGGGASCMVTGVA